MKQITPIQIWKDGALETATHFNLSIVYDDLQNSALFLYKLCRYDEENIITLAEGNQSIIDTDYQTWGTELDANEEAYTIIMSRLNLTKI